MPQIQAPHLYNLTKITGRRRSEDRETVILTVDVNVRFFRALLWALAVSIPISLLFATLIGLYSIILCAVLVGVWLILVERTSTQGLRTKTWQTIQDRRKTLAGQFIQCNEVIDSAQFEPLQVLIADVEISRPDPDHSEVFEHGSDFSSLYANTHSR